MAVDLTKQLRDIGRSAIKYALKKLEDGINAIPVGSTFKGSAGGMTGPTVGAGNTAEVLVQGTEYDEGGFYDEINDRYKAPEAGVYHIDINMSLTSAGTDLYGSVTIKNDGNPICYQTFKTTFSGDTPGMALAFSTDVEIASGKYITVEVTNSHGTDSFYVSYSRMAIHQLKSGAV